MTDIAEERAFLVNCPFPGEPRSADVGVIADLGAIVFLGLVDVLGHGQAASGTARRIQSFLEAHASRELVQLLERLHGFLRSDRGAVATLCAIDKDTGVGSYAGVGNVALRVYGSSKLHAVNKGGIIGQTMPRIAAKPISLSPGDVLVMHSDGIKGHQDIVDAQLFQSGNAKTIAERVVGGFRRPLDDASCLVYVHQT